MRLYARAACWAVFVGLIPRVAALLAARKHDVHIVEGEAIAVVLVMAVRMAMSEVMLKLSRRHSQ